MAKVICNLPNASELISGIKFAADKLGVMISEDIADDIAAEFVKIEGYALAEVEKSIASKKAAKATISTTETPLPEMPGPGAPSTTAATK